MPVDSLGTNKTLVSQNVITGFCVIHRVKKRTISLIHRVIQESIRLRGKMGKYTVRLRLNLDFYRNPYYSAVSPKGKAWTYHHIRNMIALTKGGVNHVRVE